MEKIKIFGKILLKFALGVVGVVVGVGIILLSLSLTQRHAQPPYTYGVTFRFPYAEALGLDWKKVYVDSLQSLHIEHIRIPVYWDDIQKNKGTYNFSNVDFQMSQAELHNAKVILVVGRRVPGWPECHIPGWAEQLDINAQQEEVIKEVSAIAERYKSSSALAGWQVENEPFLTKFGKCPSYDVAKYLDQEIALVRTLDPHHPIVVTDSGELSIWVRAASRADIFGSTLYRKVYADTFHRYINYHWPAIFFRAKMGFVRLLHPHKPIVNIELQAEPWTTKGITQTDFDEQAITYTKGSLIENVNFAHASGFDTTYFWGVEYWYWAADHGHPEFLQEAQTIFNSEHK